MQPNSLSVPFSFRVNSAMSFFPSSSRAATYRSSLSADHDRVGAVEAVSGVAVAAALGVDVGDAADLGERAVGIASELGDRIVVLANHVDVLAVGVTATSSLPDRPVPLVVGHSESTVDAMQLSEPPN